MPRCPVASAVWSWCAWQERQSNCMKLVFVPWHELQVIAGISEPSAWVVPEAMGKYGSCVVGSSMVFDRADPVPPCPHAAANARRTSRRTGELNRMALLLVRLRNRDRGGEITLDTLGRNVRFCE